MDKNLKDLAWDVLPKEFKEEVKKIYCTPRHRAEEYTLLQHLFGHHNLTSDAEGDEMLTCNKGVVQALYLESLKCAPKLERWKGIKWTLDHLFGSKCLPDEAKDGAKDAPKVDSSESNVDTLADNVDSLSQNPPENCDKANHISNNEHKFRRGDKAKIVGGNPEFIGKVVEIEAVDAKGTIVVFLPFAGYSTYKREYLEPYTEPTDNENLSNPTPLTNKEVTRMKPIEPKVSVYLATKEEEEEFRLLLHENGFKWNSGDSLIDLSMWSSALEEDKIHNVYPDKTVTYDGNKTPDTLTFSEFKKQYFLENVNHRQNIVNCDKQLDNILKDSFSKERRLNIAAMAMRGILSNPQLLKVTIETYRKEIGSPDIFVAVAKAAKAQADALLAECEKGGSDGN